MGVYSGIRCFGARYVKNQALLIWVVELDVLKFLLQDRSKHLVIEWRLWSELAEKTFAYFCCGSSFEFPLCYDFCFAICMFWSVQWSPPSRALPRLEALSLQRGLPQSCEIMRGKVSIHRVTLVCHTALDDNLCYFQFPLIPHYYIDSNIKREPWHCHSTLVCNNWAHIVGKSPEEVFLHFPPLYSVYKLFLLTLSISFSSLFTI